MLRPCLLGLAGLLVVGCSGAAEEPAPPPPALELTGRVVDAAEILDARFEADLSTQLESLEEDTGVQLVVVSTPDLNGHAINDYSIRLARAWGIGSAERNDGLMLLIAPTERRVRLEVGRGLEASVKDEEAAEIIRDHIIPEFEAGDYEAGVRAAVEEMIQEVTPIPMKEAA